MVDARSNEYEVDIYLNDELDRALNFSVAAAP